MHLNRIGSWQKKAILKKNWFSESARHDTFLEDVSTVCCDSTQQVNKYSNSKIIVTAMLVNWYLGTFKYKSS